MTTATHDACYRDNMRRMDEEDAGQQVVRFMGDVVNFTRIGELVDEMLAMARSQAWRRYVTGLGPAVWRECEFDYFLIACGVPYDDASRVLAWGKAGAEIGAMMNPNSDKRHRRNLADAGRSYQGAGPESLEARAARLGWTAKGTAVMKNPPISPRALSVVKDAKDLEAKAADARAEQISADRRDELDRIAASIRSKVPKEIDRRYLVDQINPARRKGRPAATVAQRAEWQSQAEAANYDAVTLAEVWAVSHSQANRRLKDLKA